MKRIAATALVVLFFASCKGDEPSAESDARSRSDFMVNFLDSATDTQGREGGADLDAVLDAVLDRGGEGVLPASPGLPGLYHLYPLGIVNGPDDVQANQSCLKGYEYTAIVRLSEQQPCLGAIHVNANDWVNADPPASTVYALMSKGVLAGATVKASWFRSWTPDGWEAYENTASYAAAARFADGSGAFSLYYDIATPPAQYPFEYGRLFSAGEGDAVSGLWHESTGVPYYLAAMAAKSGEATFLRLVGAGGLSYFDIAYGHRSGNLLYADSVWMLGHDGTWQQTLMEGLPLHYRLDITSGEEFEWWAGSESAPDSTLTFVQDVDDSCEPSYDFSACNCAEPDALCPSPICEACGPWLPAR